MTGVVLVGAGGVGRRHASVLAGLQVAVLAVVDTDLDAASALATEYGATAFTDTERALDEVDTDAVYVCSPPFARGAAERATLQRGLPLFAEKPLSADVAVAEEIAELAQRAGVITGTGYHWRCLDTVAHAVELLRTAPPLLATGYWLDKRPPVAWWGRRDGSGGQVVEQLTHVLDLARLLLGEAEEVYAAAAGGDPADLGRGGRCHRGHGALPLRRGRHLRRHLRAGREGGRGLGRARAGPAAAADRDLARRRRGPW